MIVLLQPPFFRLAGSHNDRPLLNLAYASAFLADAGVEHVLVNADWLGSATHVPWRQLFLNEQTWRRACDGDSPLYDETLELVLQYRPTTVVIATGDDVIPTKNVGSPYTAAHVARRLKPYARVIGVGQFAAAYQAVDPVYDAVFPSLVNRSLVDLVLGEEPLVTSGAPLGALPTFTHTRPHCASDYVMSAFGCVYSCSFSVTGDTWVLTEQGPRQVVDLDSGGATLVNCPHGVVTRLSPVAVRVASADGLETTSTFADEGLMPVLRLELENGLRLRGTHGHKIAVVRAGREAFARLDEVRPGDWVSLRDGPDAWGDYVEIDWRPSARLRKPGDFVPKEVRIPSRLDEDLGWVLGFLIGDGWINDRPNVGHVGFAVNDRTEGPLQEKLERLFGCRACVRQPKNTAKMRIAQVTSRTIADFLRGLIGPKKLRVPESIMRSPRSVAEAFLAGLWAADGYVTGRDDYLTTTSRELADGVAMLLINMQCRPSIQTVIQTERAKNPGSLSYRVSRSSKHAFIPTGYGVYQTRGVYSFRRSGSAEGARAATLERYGLKHELAQPGRWYQRVRSIEPDGVERVYDLTVPATQSFVANGMLVHNCWAPRVAGRQMLFQPPEVFVDDLEHRAALLGTRKLYVADMIFPINRRRLRAVAAMLAERGHTGSRRFELSCECRVDLVTEEVCGLLAAMGVRTVKLGIESIDDDTLDAMGKRTSTEQIRAAVALLQREGIRVVGYLIFGSFYRSEKAMWQTLERAQQLALDYVVVNVEAYQQFGPEHRYDAHFSLATARQLGVPEDVLWAALDLQEGRPNPTLAKVGD